MFAIRALMRRNPLNLARNISKVVKPQLDDLSLFQRVKYHYNNTEKCIFTQDLKPWQRLVCGCVGVCGCAAGVAGLYHVLTTNAHLFSKCVYSITEKIIKISVLTDDSSILLKTLFNIKNFVGDIYNNFPEAVSDPVKLTAAGAVSTGVVLFICKALNMCIPHVIPFFKNIANMNRCCNIIRTVADGSLFIGNISIVVSMGLFTSYISVVYMLKKINDIKYKYKNGVYQCDVRTDDVPFIFNPLHF